MENKKRMLKTIQAFGVEIGKSLVSICAAILVGALVILAIGENPIEAFTELIRGAFGSRT